MERNVPKHKKRSTANLMTINTDKATIIKCDNLFETVI